MTLATEIVIFGATHGGIRLAERLFAQSHPVTLIDPAPPPEVPRGWNQVRSDFAVPADIGRARVIYAVTDQDKVNLRIALAVRRSSPTVPIVITLTQSPLGEKLARHLRHFAFVNPPELAAGRFVEAVYAAQPAGAGAAAAAAAAPPAPEAAERWRPDPLVLRAVMVLCAIGVAATCYFHFAERLSWIDALYFTVTTMATVGFGDINLKDSSTFSKLHGVA